MLPDPNHSPSGVPKACGLTSVAVLVLREFGQPVVLVGLRVGRMLRTPMPEAAIDKYGDSGLHEYDIHLDAFHAALQSEALAFSMKY